MRPPLYISEISAAGAHELPVGYIGTNSMKVQFAFVALGAAILLVLALVLAILLLPTCGVRFGGFGEVSFCRFPAASGLSSALAAEAERQAVLEDRLRGLERRLAAFPACPMPLPAQAEPETAQPEPEPEGLDPERWRERDTALLEGCWSLGSDYTLRNRSTGVVTRVDSWEMCFDAEGSGEQQFALSDGRECEADVTAEFLEDGRLRISDRENVQCTRGTYIFRRIIDCELEQNGEAACEARQPETSSRSNVRISRRASR